MKRLRLMMLFVGGMIFFPTVMAQTVLWTEDFSSGASIRGTLGANYPALATGNWTQTNIGVQGPDANEWYVSVEECGAGADSCGFVCPVGRNDASLHISAIGGLCGTPDCGAAYDAGGVITNTTTNKRLESPNINTTGFGTISVQFNYIGFGDGANDRAQLVYSCNGGANWTVLATLTSQCCCLLPGFCGGPDPIPCTNIFSGQGYWRAANFPLPACAEDIPNLKVGFLWTNNNDGVGTDPSFAVDDITVSYDFVLEARLEELQATRHDNYVELNWQTELGSSFSRFSIERKAAESFVSIGEIQAELSQENSYSFQDFETPFGPLTYQVTAYGTDGRVALQQQIEIQPTRLSGVRTLKVISSNAKNELIIEGLSEGRHVLELFNLQGKKVMQEKFTARTSIHRQLLPMTLPEGIYTIRLTPTKGLPVSQMAYISAVN